MSIDIQDITLGQYLTSVLAIKHNNSSHLILSKEQQLSTESEFASYILAEETLFDSITLLIKDYIHAVEWEIIHEKSSEAS